MAYQKANYIDCEDSDKDEAIQLSVWMKHITLPFLNLELTFELKLFSLSKAILRKVLKCEDSNLIIIFKNFHASHPVENQ